MLPGVIGSLQAMEAIKLLAGLGKPPLGRLVHYHALDSSFREIKIKKDPHCPLCGDNPNLTEESLTSSSESEMTALPEISTLELREILEEGFEGILLDVRELDEHSMANIPSAKLVPLSGWPDAATNLSKDTKYLVLCAAGMRSHRAGSWMLENGFEDVTNVVGGMKQWLLEEGR